MPISRIGLREKKDRALKSFIIGANEHYLEEVFHKREVTYRVCTGDVQA